MKGLVIDRIRRLQTGQPVLASRRCRLSYGILSAVPFDPNVHEDQDVVTDPVDGRKYANNIIKWIIKKVRVASKHNEANLISARARK